MNHTIERAMEMGRNDLSGLFDDVKSTELAELAREADAAAQRAAWLGTYLDRRSASDAHDDAVEYADAQLKRVRKTMGYSYP